MPNPPEYFRPLSPDKVQPEKFAQYNKGKKFTQPSMSPMFQGAGFNHNASPVNNYKLARAAPLPSEEKSSSSMMKAAQPEMQYMIPKPNVSDWSIMPQAVEVPDEDLMLKGFKSMPAPNMPLFQLGYLASIAATGEFGESKVDTSISPKMVRQMTYGVSITPRAALVPKSSEPTVANVSNKMGVSRVNSMLSQDL